MPHPGVYRAPLPDLLVDKLKAQGFALRILCVNSQIFGASLQVATDGSNLAEVVKSYRLIAQDLSCDGRNVPHVTTLVGDFSAQTSVGLVPSADTRPLEQRACLLSKMLYQPFDAPTAFAMPFRAAPTLFLLYDYASIGTARNVLVSPAMVRCRPTLLAASALQQAFANFRMLTNRRFPDGKFRPERVWAVLSPGAPLGISREVCQKLPKVKGKAQFLTETRHERPFTLDVCGYVQRLLVGLGVFQDHIVTLNQLGGDSDVWQPGTMGNLMAGVLYRTR